MTDLGLTHDLTSNANVDSEHADASANGASGGALSASEGGATYDGSAGADTTWNVDAPDMPDVPEMGGVDHAADVTGTAGGAANDASAHADAALSSVGSLDTPDVPDVPDVDGTLDGALSAAGNVHADDSSVNAGGGLDGFLDALGDVMAQFAAHVSAMFGL